MTTNEGRNGMGSVASLYAKTIHQHFTPMYANWQPGTPIGLGDYGTISDNIFTRIGNIGDPPLSITFATRDDTAADQYEFTSSANTEFTFHVAASGGGGNVASANASVDIKFGSSNSVYFNAAGCRLISIEDIASLGAELIKHEKTGAWKTAFAVVTSVMDAKATTVIVSTARNAAISLEAKGEGVKTVDLADASIKLGFTHSKNVGFKVITADGMTPLLGLMQVKRSRDILGRVRDPRFEPALTAKLSEATTKALDESVSDRTSGRGDALVFVTASGNPVSDD